MAYKTNPAPYQRTKKSTLQIMIELGIALAIVWLAAVITTFIKLGSSYGVKSILLMVVSVAVTFACDAINTVARNKKDKTLGKKIVYDLIHNYSWITAMIFTLLCPVWTSYYVVIVGSIFASVIGKLVFGGFGKNIFNPAAMGRIFIQLCFDLSAPDSVHKGLDTVTGGTLTGAFNSTQQWLGSYPLEGYSTWDILLGNYFGTMGETFTILLVVLGVILAIRGVINWRAPVFYVGTVAISSLLIGLVLGFENPLLYMIYHLGLGGLMFGAVFMITDPVTTPTSPFGNCIVGVVAALLTVLLRVGTNNVEGVVYSIAIVNLISPSLDVFITAKTNKNTGVKAGVTFGLSALSVALTVAMAWSANGGREINTINGLSRPVYEELESYTTTFTFMEEKDYQFSIYSKGDDPAGTKGVGKCAGAYSIVNASLEEVGVVYGVPSNVYIDMNGFELEVESVAYVAISTETGKVLGISPASKGYQGDVYGNKVKDFLGGYDFENNDFTVVDVPSLQTGASYSLVGMQQMANAALTIYNAAYGK